MERQWTQCQRPNSVLFGTSSIFFRHDVSHALNTQWLRDHFNSDRQHSFSLVKARVTSANSKSNFDQVKVPPSRFSLFTGYLKRVPYPIVWQLKCAFDSVDRTALTIRWSIPEKCTSEVCEPDASTVLGYLRLHKRYGRRAGTACMQQQNVGNRPVNLNPIGRQQSIPNCMISTRSNLKQLQEGRKSTSWDQWLVRILAGNRGSPKSQRVTFACWVKLGIRVETQRTDLREDGRL